MHVVVIAVLVLATATVARADIRAGDAEKAAVVEQVASSSSAPATAQGATQGASSVPATPRTTTMPTTDDDIRARVVDIEQTLDRLLADTTPAPVGTTGTVGATPASATVTIDRARLLQLREQLEALLATLNRR